MKYLLLLFLLFSTSIYSQTVNRYSSYSTSTFTPKSDEDIYRELLIKERNLNYNIGNLLFRCEDLLNDPKFCYGDFRSSVQNVKNRLENVNKRASNGFISIYDVNNIYNSCVKEFNNALKKHKKIINNLNVKEANEIKDKISNIESKIRNTLKNKKNYTKRFVSDLSHLQSMIKKTKYENSYKENDILFLKHSYDNFRVRYESIIDTNKN